jgi:hypothetical protein
LLGLNRLCFQGKLAEVERQDAEKIQGVFGWAVAVRKAAVSCGCGKSCCEMWAVKKAESRLASITVAVEKADVC